MNILRRVRYIFSSGIKGFRNSHKQNHEKELLKKEGKDLLHTLRKVIEEVQVEETMKKYEEFKEESEQLVKKIEEREKEIKELIIVSRKTGQNQRAEELKKQLEEANKTKAKALSNKRMAEESAEKLKKQLEEANKTKAKTLALKERAEVFIEETEESKKRARERVAELIEEIPRTLDLGGIAGELAILGKPAVEPLITVFTHEDWLECTLSAIALGIIRDKRAIAPLISALSNGDEHVQRAAASALTNLTGKDFGVDHEKWQKWWKQNKEEFLKGR